MKYQIDKRLAALESTSNVNCAPPVIVVKFVSTAQPEAEPAFAVGGTVRYSRNADEASNDFIERVRGAELARHPSGHSISIYAFDREKDAERFPLLRQA